MSEGWLRHLSWPRKRQNTEFMGEILFKQVLVDHWEAGVLCKGQAFLAVGANRVEAARNLLEMVANGPS